MLRFIDGFEVVPPSMLNIKWATVNLTTPVLYVPGRNNQSGQALQFVGTALTSQQFPNAATYVVGFGFKWSGFTDSPAIFQFLCGSDVQIGLTFNLGRQTFQVNSGVSVLAVGNTVLLPNQWYYVEFKATIDPSAGSYTLRINGTTDITASNVNTCGASLDGNIINTINFQGASTGFYVLDDIYLLDTTGSANNDFLGAMIVEKLVMNHEGDFSQWTVASSNPNLLNWEAVSAVDGDRVMSQTVGAEDTYGVSRLQAISTTVAGVSVHYIGRSDGVGNHTINPVARIGGTSFPQSAQMFTASQNLELITSIMEQNPATSAAWTVSDFHDIQFGMVLAS
jgi:hypothetical protein